jgi:hypothetical protein
MRRSSHEIQAPLSALCPRAEQHTGRSSAPPTVRSASIRTETVVARLSGVGAPATRRSSARSAGSREKEPEKRSATCHPSRVPARPKLRGDRPGGCCRWSSRASRCGSSTGPSPDPPAPGRLRLVRWHGLDGGARPGQGTGHPPGRQDRVGRPAQGQAGRAGRPGWRAGRPPERQDRAVLWSRFLLSYS